jgi:uncharacterized membrane protein
MRVLKAAIVSTALCSPVLAQSFQSLGVPPGATAMYATGISGDGTIVVGYMATPQGDRPFRWSAAGGVEQLPLLAAWPQARAKAISRDGNVIVGEWGESASPRPARWATGAAPQDLGLRPGHPWNTALAVNGDGTIVAGFAFRWMQAGGLEALPPGMYACTGLSDDGDVMVGFTDFAVYWSAAAGLSILPPTGWPHVYPFANAVSADGSIVVGGYYSWGPGSALRWTVEPATGTLLAFDELGMATSDAVAISGNGRIAAGWSDDRSGSSATVWVGAARQVNLREFLMWSGVDLSEWELRTVTAVSSDGRTLAGWGVRQGTEQAWIVTLPPWFECYGNCDGSTVQPILNIDDFVCFINEFAMAMQLPHAQQVTHYANCDRQVGVQPILNIDDFTCFMMHYAMGCP